MFRLSVRVHSEDVAVSMKRETLHLRCCGRAAGDYQAWSRPPLSSGRVTPPASVPPPEVFHVDPAVQMSHVPASSCSEFALKGRNGSEAVRDREPVWVFVSM